jgi:hypothetical protein
MVSKIMKFWQNKPIGRKRNKKWMLEKMGIFFFMCSPPHLAKSLLKPAFSLIFVTL